MSEAAARTGVAGRGVVIGALLLVPRLVLAWFLGLDALQLLAALLAAAGSVVLALGFLRPVVGARRGRRLIVPASVGVVVVVGAAVIAVLLHGTGYVVAAEGGTMPAQASLVQLTWTLVGVLAAIGAVLAVGSVLAAAGPLDDRS